MPFHGEYDAFDKYGNGYKRDFYPHSRKSNTWSDYVLLPPLLQIPKDSNEAFVYLERQDPGLSSGINAPFGIWDEIDICRDWLWRHETVTDIGHIFWAQFNSIEPCWLLWDETEAYKFLTEDEYGHQRPLAARN